MSRTLLQYFQDLFNHHFSEGSDEVYVPFTNANDFDAFVATQNYG